MFGRKLHTLVESREHNPKGLKRELFENDVVGCGNIFDGMLDLKDNSSGNFLECFKERNGPNDSNLCLIKSN